jgi:multidrug efflux pump subunit AcrA (membrane-fusion protein)
MRGKWVLVAGSLVLLALVAGAVALLRQERTARANAEAAKQAEKQPVLQELSLPGKIQARNVVSVPAPIGGRIEAFLVDAGQEVFEGQMLARITSQGLETTRELAESAARSAQARISKIEAEIISVRLEASRARADAIRSRTDFDRASKTYQRQKLLYDNGATARLVYEKSQKEFESAKVESESLEVLARQADDRLSMLTRDLQDARKILEDKTTQLEDAQAHLQTGEVHAPVSGLVVARKGEAGENQEQGAELFQIATNLAALQVVLEADPSFLARLKPAQTVGVILADVPETIAGSIKEIQEHLATVDFVSPTPLVKPGMTAQVRIRLD